MSMAVPTAPNAGERPGPGSRTGPNPYVPGAGNGFLIDAPQLSQVTRVVAIRERTGRLLVQQAAAVAGDRGNQVRVRVYYPHHSMAVADVRTALRAGAVAPADHLAANIQGAAPIDDHLALGVQNALGIAAHAHDTVSMGVAGPPAVALGLNAGLNQLDDAGAAALHTFAGGGATGIQNTTNGYGAGLALAHTDGAGAAVAHAAWDGVAVVPVAVGEECGAIDLSTYTFDMETVGF